MNQLTMLPSFGTEYLASKGPDCGSGAVYDGPTVAERE
jgi:hypothetical protein